MRSSTRADLVRALGLRPARLLEDEPAPKAAVALVFRERDQKLELLFIHRAEHPDDPWSGQMAFPGGRAEVGDPDLRATAVRETSEEIGIDLAVAADPLGSLDETRAVSRMRPMNLTITPFVFWLRGAGETTLSDEVRSVHWLPLDDLLSSRYRELMDYAFDEQRLKFPCFRIEGKTIWGLTYRMFANLQGLIEESAG